MPTLHLGDIAIEVIHKPIRNVHLSVHPPEGRIKRHTHHEPKQKCI